MSPSVPPPPANWSGSSSRSRNRGQPEQLSVRWSSPIEDAFGNVVTTDTSTVSLTLNSKAFSTGSSTVTVTAVNGVATFGSLAVDTTGTYRIAASDSASLTIVTSGSVAITPGALSSLVVQQSPTTGSAGVALGSIVKVAALDQFGNLVTASTTVALTLTSGTFSSGSTTVTATTSGGIASFAGLIMNIAGNYTLTASVGSLSGPSFGVTMNPAAANQPVWQTAPGATGVAGTALNPVLVAVQDVFGNQVTANATVTLKLTGGKFSNGSTQATALASGGVVEFQHPGHQHRPGHYTLTACVGSQTTTSSSMFTISPAAASKLVWQTAPVCNSGRPERRSCPVRRHGN